MNSLNLLNKRFGRLLVIERDKNTKYGKTTWKCLCDCGNTKIITGYLLKSGNTKSCGCLRKEITAKNGHRIIKHGKTNTRLYTIWEGMKSRCYYIKNNAYKNYGGRGIKICNEWLDKENGFINFYNWAINNGYKDNLTIDRIDVDGDYRPNNCKWVTMKVQENNRRNNRTIKYKDKNYTLSKLANELNLIPATLRWRIEHNWDTNDLSLLTNFANKKIRKEFKNE